MPNPGRIRMYTSGCPKNQKRCWYKMGSPPPAGSKKVVFRFRSVSSIVIAPAKTGRDSRSKITVTTIAQQNRVIRSNSIREFRIFVTVHKKLMAPRIDDTPAR